MLLSVDFDKTFQPSRIETIQSIVSISIPLELLAKNENSCCCKDMFAISSLLIMTSRLLWSDFNSRGALLFSKLPCLCLLIFDRLSPVASNYPRNFAPSRLPASGRAHLNGGQRCGNLHCSSFFCFSIFPFLLQVALYHHDHENPKGEDMI